MIRLLLIILAFALVGCGTGRPSVEKRICYFAGDCEDGYFFGADTEETVEIFLSRDELKSVCEYSGLQDSPPGTFVSFLYLRADGSVYGRSVGIESAQ